MRCNRALLPVFGLLVLLVGGTTASGQPRPGSTEEFATVEMRRIEKLAADPKADRDKLWQELVDFRRCYPAQPQTLRAAELMAKVRSPLDALDRKQIPEEDRLPWLPAEVVAVQGEHRGRHPRPVTDVRVSPDSKWILGVAWRDVRVWDATTLNERKWFPKGLCGDWSEDGKVLAVGGQDDTVWLYDVSNGEFKEVAVLVAKKRPVRKYGPDTIGPGREVRSVGLTSNCKGLVAVSDDLVVRVWDLASKTPRERSVFDAEPMGQNLKVLPGGQRVLGEQARRGETLEPGLHLWNITGEKPRREGVLEECSFPAALAPDGRTLAVYKFKIAAIELWDIVGLEPKALRLLSGDVREAASLAFSRDGNVLHCGCGQFEGCSVLQMPVNEAGRKRLRLAEGSTHLTSDVGFVVWSAQVFPDGKTLALGGRDGTVRLWDIGKDEAKSPARRGHVGAVASAIFSADDKTLVTAGEDRTIRFWYLDKGCWKEREVLRGLMEAVPRLAISPDGKVLAAIVSGKHVRLWQLTESGAKERAVFEAHSFEVCSIAFGSDSATLVTGGSDRGPATEKDKDGYYGRQLTVRLWNLAVNSSSERLVAIPKSRPNEADEERDAEQFGVGEAFSAVLSPDGKLLACAAGGAARVWKAGDKAAEEWAVIVPKKHESIKTVAFSPDGKTLATGGYDYDEGKTRFHLWDLTGSPLRERLALTGHEIGTNDLAFSGDGKTLFAHEHCKVLCWDVASGRLLNEFVVSAGSTGFALAHDGRHLATSNRNGTVYLFRQQLAHKIE